MTNLIVDFCDHKAALYSVKHWHYSKSMPTPPVVKIGVWENDVFIGCVLFSRGANKNLNLPFGIRDVEVCELARVALNIHLTAVTRIISRAIKLLKINSPGLRLIVSYADSNHGHVGVIYQAGNWVYTGTTPGSYLYKDKYGRIFHQRQVSKTGVKPQYGELRVVPKIAECEKIFQTGKYRYVYPLDKSMRKRIRCLSRPYPRV